MESAGDVGDAGLVTIVFAAVLCLAIAGLMLEVVLAGGLVSAAPTALGIGSGAPGASCFVCITLAGGGSGGLTGLGTLAAALGAGSSNGVLGCTSGVNSGTLRVEGSGGTHSVFQDPTLHVGRGEAPTGNNSLFTAPFVLLPATGLGCGHFAFLLGRGAGLGAGSGDGFQGSVSAVDARENSAGEMDLNMHVHKHARVQTCVRSTLYIMHLHCAKYVFIFSIRPQSLLLAAGICTKILRINSNQSGEDGKIKLKVLHV